MIEWKILRSKEGEIVDNPEKAVHKVERVVYFFKRTWATWIFSIIGASVVLLFSFSLIFDKKIELQIINNWIGIILGLVATIASIISLFLSFYNLELEREESKENRSLMEGLRATLRELERTQQDINKRLDEQVKATKEIREEMTTQQIAKPTIIDDKNDVEEKSVKKSDYEKIWKKIYYSTNAKKGEE